MKQLTQSSIIAKPHGAKCNLACDYCYYLRKDTLYPESDFRMNEVVLESYIRQFIAIRQVPEVTFVWQGGEPTRMGLDFFKRAVSLQKKYRQPGMRIQNALQTNGTTLNDDWCRFLRRNNFLVGVSLDGPSLLHNKFRGDKSGNPTFERVMAGIACLQKHQVDVNILTCVHSVNADHPIEVYRFLRDVVGIKFIQFIPIVEQQNETCGREGATVSDRSVNGRQYGQFLIEIFDEWVRHDVGSVFVQIFEVALGLKLGLPASLCVFAETCGNALVLEHTGDLFSCDHFVGPEHQLGNIMETSLSELMDSPQQRNFGIHKLEGLPRFCLECDVRFLCNGGCPKNRVKHTPNGEPGLNYLCEGYRTFFKHIDPTMSIMCDLLHKQQSPSKIMDIIAVSSKEKLGDASIP
jgi:uncharacterized protein